MQPSSGPAPGQPIVLDEAEHQALDLLDSLASGPQWRANPADAASHAAIRAAIRAELETLGEPPEAFDAALAQARSALTRIVQAVARVVGEAAAYLAETGDRGQLEPGAVAELRRRLDAQPESALGQAWAIELAHELLGFDPDNLSAALLDQLGADAGAGEPDAVSSSIAERLGAARAGTSSVPLRVFRTASVSMGGPYLRAAMLATEHPEQLALAKQLVEVVSDPLELVQTWDRALASIDGPPADPLELVDGPKRKFTIVHAILALLVLGLTLWHYLWR